MIESVLVKHNAKIGTKITVKSLISVGVVALAVLLPQLVHLVAGASGGVQWLPMYLPVLLGRVPARLEMGTGCRHPFAARQFRNYFAYGQCDARRIPPSVYDGRTRSIRRRIGVVLEKNCRKRLDGVPRRPVGAGERQGGIPRACRYLPGRFRAVRGGGVVADPGGAVGYGLAGGARSLHRNGAARLLLRDKE